VDASGRTDQTFTLASGQTLGGIGAVTGNLTVSPGATIAPSGTNTTIGITTGANPFGAISASANVSLGGATVIKLGSGTNDVVQAGGNISYGGTLNLVNASGAPLAAGNSFHIFTAAGFSGSFAAGIVPTTPGPGLVWDTTQLGSGIISVATGASQPVLGGAAISSGNFIFSGSNGPANGNYVVLTTTNLATALTNWTPLVTNAFDSNGAFHYTNGVDTTVPHHFYTIKLQ
jgi:fibronectin-binding autotransporter adhesin